ncbi:MAG TPA: 4-oxalocrotonate tautomerase family protein [Geminicoccus sp.]|uniref:tautomerase family protein n=1 Tax=Geminicoccus sp. TaxID=2024832 RepID=UPI002BDD7033|nr:4-oxalocrotonate tautomerase family protein [Geminicoccus sp.]HWL70846.1 4-oxalocrotonate tautomerase family protein [Geminicoccus sp.]
MPIISVQLATVRPIDDLERQVAARVAGLSSSILRKQPELTAVIVQRVDPAAWFAGGRSLAEQGRSSFWLEIRVVDGTNSKDEKAAFVAAVFALFEELLGSLHHESYVHVHEVAADAYGFGGRTQERRYIEAAPAPTARAA